MKKLLTLLAALLTFTSTAFAQIGSDDVDLVFTPVTPCRIMDTRNAGAISGILVAGTTRTFNGNSTGSNYPSQGSSNASCGIPFVNDVAAIVLNFTTVTPAAAGYITVFPANAAQPTAATVNFTAGSVVGNNATLKVSQSSAAAQFKIYTTSNVHVVADVVGYYSKPVSSGSLSCSYTLLENESIPAGFASFRLTPNCASGTVAVSTYCFNGTNNFLFSTGSGPGFCGWRNTGGTDVTATQATLCCRIPGR